VILIGTDDGISLLAVTAERLACIEIVLERKAFKSGLSGQMAIELA
jgi:hypothetical protein